MGDAGFVNAGGFQGGLRAVKLVIRISYLGFTVPSKRKVGLRFGHYILTDLSTQLDRYHIHQQARSPTRSQ